jgi:hypothetical protein
MEELSEVRRLGRLLDDGEVGALIDRLGELAQVLAGELASVRLELAATRVEPSLLERHGLVPADDRSMRRGA